MQAVIGHRLIASLKGDTKPYEIRGAKLKGFIRRVQPSGAMSDICEYNRGKRITLGRANLLTAAQAHEQALGLSPKPLKVSIPERRKNLPKSMTWKPFWPASTGPGLRQIVKTAKRRWRG